MAKKALPGKVFIWNYNTAVGWRNSINQIDIEDAPRMQRYLDSLEVLSSKEPTWKPKVNVEGDVKYPPEVVAWEKAGKGWLNPKVTIKTEENKSLHESASLCRFAGEKGDLCESIRLMRNSFQNHKNSVQRELTNPSKHQEMILSRWLEKMPMIESLRNLKILVTYPNQIKKNIDNFFREKKEFDSETRNLIVKFFDNPDSSKIKQIGTLTKEGLTRIRIRVDNSNYRFCADAIVDGDFLYIYENFIEIFDYRIDGGYRDFKKKTLRKIENIENRWLNEDASKIRLYRGLTKEFDDKYDASKTDSQHGYSTWTDNLELAKQYAGKNGYVYYLDLPKSEMGKSYIDENPKSDNYGDRVLFYQGKDVGLNDVKGKEYLVYTFHDLYNPAMVKKVEKTVEDIENRWLKEKVAYHGTNANFKEFRKSEARLGKNYGDGHYFTTSTKQASKFAGDEEGANVHLVDIDTKNFKFWDVSDYREYLKICKELGLTPGVDDKDLFSSLRFDAARNVDDDSLRKYGNSASYLAKKLEELGYAGLVIRNPKSYSKSTWYVVYDDKAIKHKFVKEDNSIDEVTAYHGTNRTFKEGVDESSNPKLNKPMRGDVKKYKVFVRDSDTGNIKKVNFGDPNMEIKRDDPERRKSFRARHKCDAAKDKTTPRYWSCKFWSKKPVSDLLKEDINDETWYHGGEKKYDKLLPGGGIDGPGIYLTRDKKRAEMYAKKDKHGNERPTIYVHEVHVNLDKDKIWDYEKRYDLRDYTDAQWLKDMINEYGENAAFKNGQNARIYLGWDDNEELKKHGFDAILNNDDLIILNDKVIVKLESKSNLIEDEINPSREKGSLNYQLAKQDGWIEGDAKYAKNTPHHGPEYIYTNMHDPEREKELVKLFETDEPIEIEVDLRFYPKDKTDTDNPDFENGIIKVLDDNGKEFDLPNGCDWSYNDDPVAVMDREGDIEYWDINSANVERFSKNIRESKSNLEEDLNIKQIKWSYPSEKELMDEFHEPDIDSLVFFAGYPTPEERKEAFEFFKNNLKEIELDPSELEGDNTWRFKHKDYKSFRDLVKSYGGPKDPDSMVRKIQAGGELPMPVVVRMADGSLKLAGGATRVSIALLAKQKIKALVFDEVVSLKKKIERKKKFISEYIKKSKNPDINNINKRVIDASLKASPEELKIWEYDNDEDGFDGHILGIHWGLIRLWESKIRGEQ